MHSAIMQNLDCSRAGASRDAQPRIACGATSGFTLIELLVTMTIIGIALAIGVPSLQSFIGDQHVRATATDFDQDMAFTRSSAIAASKQAIIQPLTAGNWMGGWQIYLDNDASGSLTAGDTLIKTSPATTGTLKICPSPVGGPNAAEFNTNIIFRPDGTVVRTSAISASDGMVVSDTLGSASASNYKIRTLYFGPGGRITVIQQNGETNGGVPC